MEREYSGFIFEAKLAKIASRGKFLVGQLNQIVLTRK